MCIRDRVKIPLSWRNCKKGVNKVSSFLYNFMQNTLPETAKEIHVFSDRCIGQNWNHTVLRSLLGLSVSHKISVTQYFPVKGYSFLLCDRTFGVIKRCLKKSDSLHTYAIWKNYYWKLRWENWNCSIARQLNHTRFWQMVAKIL